MSCVVYRSDPGIAFLSLVPLAPIFHRPFHVRASGVTVRGKPTSNVASSDRGGSAQPRILTQVISRGTLVVRLVQSGRDFRDGPGTTHARCAERHCLKRWDGERLMECLSPWKHLDRVGIRLVRGRGCFGVEVWRGWFGKAVGVWI